MYIKLVLRSARRSLSDYALYLVTMTICVTLFYAFLSLSSRYYHPNIGTYYDLTFLSDGLRLAVCAVTLLLLFLIRFVDRYMLTRRQKEMALQTLMGMEQRTVGWLFLAETLLMGALALAGGILLGALCSQLITAQLYRAYGLAYHVTWMLYPDTIGLTVGFFALSLLAVGLVNMRTIRRLPIITMLKAERLNDKPLAHSRFLPVVTVLYALLLLAMLWTGVWQMHLFFDRRMAWPLYLMFGGNILLPAAALGLCLGKLIRRKHYPFQRFIQHLTLLAILNTGCMASVPKLREVYYLALSDGALNQYLLFTLAHLIFIICGVMFLLSTYLTAWKERSPEIKYHQLNLFFFGQVLSKLTTTSRSMTLICLTLTLAIFLFALAPALTSWAEGYLEVRSLYAVQINSRYNQVYDEADLPRDDYALVSQFLQDEQIAVTFDRTFNLYLPEREDFHARVKWQFPVAALSLSDYNALRDMLGYGPITLADGQFTTHWQTIATAADRDAFLQEHPRAQTDAGELTLAAEASHEEPMGETLFNSYTDVVYIFPDAVCQELLPVMRNRYLQTAEPIPYDAALALEQAFSRVYPEGSTNGPTYAIRTRTRQVNDSLASNFVLQSLLTYGAVVLLVFCLTMLALQQLLDAGQHRYRFSVLRKLGVDEKTIDQLIFKQLAVWFGLPIGLAVLISLIAIVYFLQTISAQIAAYIGLANLLGQLLGILGILTLLLICYFVTTWLLFKRSLAADRL